jgi:anti-sigma factor RsiW
MTRVHEPIPEADLIAYVDDQLDTSRRVDVEAYLAGHPAGAARVMADLRTRDELRLALATSTSVAKPATRAAVRRLERGLTRGRFLGGLQRALAVVTLLAAGWFAHDALGPLSVSQVVASTPPPPYVDDAVQAHRTTIVRATMKSQPEISDYDPIDIRAATAIVMPDLPKNWRVLDVQVYPSKFGPSVEVAVETAESGMMSLFAVRPGTFEVVAPSIAPTGDVSAAYFQVGEVAYALVAAADTRDLDRAASRLADTLQ